MHGVKRLFSWMIPRFDPRSGSTCRCVSLRKKDLSEETLEALGIDITYLERSKFDPMTLPALLKVVDRKQIDVLHLHGYGATTFGRLVAAAARHPDDPARAREPHRHAVVSEGRRSPARAVHRHRHRGLEEHGRFRDRRAPDARVEGEGRLPGRAARGVQPPSNRRTRSRPRGRSSASARGRVRHRHGHPAARLERELVPGRRGGTCRRRERPAARFFLVGEGPLLPDLQAQAARLGLGDRFVFAGFQRDVARTLSAFDLSVFPSLWEGTPITPSKRWRWAKPIVATDADGLLDILTDGSRRGDRPAARRRRAGGENRLG